MTEGPAPATLPRLVISGPPLARGRQYGQRARERIHRSIESYRALFIRRAGLDWPSAVRRASRYRSSIGDFLPDALLEMQGIAEGADVELGDVLALNARSELMFAGAAPDRGHAGECTSFAVLPEATADGHTLIGQNWDWLPFARETMVLLEVRREEGPGYLTVAEAGHLAKVGFNTAGLGVCTNTLVSALDDGRPGVPYHVLLRALLDAETMSQAARTLYAAERAFSANYVIAHEDGLAMNVETLPGDTGGVHVALPENGVLWHANHFLVPEFARHDARVATHPNTIFRAHAMRRAIEGERGLTVERLQNVLRGHQNHPEGICGHPDERLHPLEQRRTIASVIADLTLGTVWVAPGPPCSTSYERHCFRSALPRSRERASIASVT